MDSIDQFRRDNKVLTIGALIAIFSFALVHSLKTNILTPAIMAFFPRRWEKLEVKINGSELLVGEFLAELFQFTVIIIPLFLMWFYVNKRRD
jgi:large-conductance mechanosensitive channel